MAGKKSPGRNGARRRSYGWRTAYLGIGANLGDRRRNIRLAMRMLNRVPGIRVVRISRLIETDPVGGPPGQPMFLNGAAKILTRLDPRRLLDALMEVERRLGRDRGREARNGPRPIDLDLLLYGSCVLRCRGLTIPHPRMHGRMFVLGPMAEIAPRAVHPLLGRTMASLAEMLAAERIAAARPAGYRIPPSCTRLSAERIAPARPAGRGRSAGRPLR